VETGACAYHAELLQNSRRPSSSCCGCRCRTEDRGTALQRARCQLAGGAGGRGARGTACARSRAWAPKGSAHHQGDRGTSERQRPRPAAARGGNERRAARLSARACPGSRVRPRRQPAARLRDLRRPRYPRGRRRPHGDGSLCPVPGRRAGARARRRKEQHSPARRPPGRSPSRPRREPRRGDAVFHRLEDAQHRVARSRHSARPQAE
jgi:hypothetical protein